MAQIIDGWTFEFVIIPLLICLARITDVTMGTVRIIFVSKGIKMAAAVLGFFEVIIWLIAVGQIMQNLTNWVNYIAYGAGFGIGNWVGIKVEERISIGYVVVRIITRKTAEELISYLKESGHRYTILDATSDEGPVNVVFMPIKRREVGGLIRKVREFNPRAAYTVEDLRSVSGQFRFTEEELSPGRGLGPSYGKPHIVPRSKK